MWGSTSFFDVPRTEVFRRYEAFAGFDANGDILEATETVLTGITGDLQIYKIRPIGQLEAPDGFTLQGAFRFSTKFELRTMDEYPARKADTMEKDGRIWYVWRKLAGGTGGPLSLDAYNDYVLVLQGLPNSGAPT
jgi:hypothetical protein